jgi:hypothetical protein
MLHLPLTHQGEIDSYGPLDTDATWQELVAQQHEFEDTVQVLRVGDVVALHHRGTYPILEAWSESSSRVFVARWSSDCVSLHDETGALSDGFGSCPGGVMPYDSGDMNWLDRRHALETFRLPPVAADSFVGDDDGSFAASHDGEMCSGSEDEFISDAELIGTVHTFINDLVRCVEIDSMKDDLPFLLPGCRLNLPAQGSKLSTPTTVCARKKMMSGEDALFLVWDDISLGQKVCPHRHHHCHRVHAANQPLGAPSGIR